SEAVVMAMATSLEASIADDLCDRLVAAVEAGARAGGQAEGQRSAAILVFDTEPFAHLDLRVDWHDDAVAELRRIYDSYRPLIPYFRLRPYNPGIAREDRWLTDQTARGRH
ncbi:MAG: DUF1028 domain-containing protein, partial [Acetobacteraceae bacterium]